LLIKTEQTVKKKTACFFYARLEERFFSIRFFLSGSGQRKKLGKKETPPFTRSGCFLEVSKKQAKSHHTLNSKF